MSGESEALMPKAVRLHQAGQLDEAAQLYRQIIESAPQDFDAIHLLGLIDLQEGRLESARDRILAALHINPWYAAALNNLGTVYLRLGHAQTALGLAERALFVDPDLFDGLINQGTALRQLSRPAEAIAPLRKAFGLNGKSLAVCNLLGACLLDSADPQAAAEIFETGVEADPRNAESWANLSVALTATHEHTRALECAHKSIELNPLISSGFSALAASQLEQGEVNAALSSYRSAANLPDVTDKTLADYANTLLASGHNAEAMEQLRRVIEMEGNNAVARWKLAMANCKAIYNDESEIQTSRAAFSHALEELHEWFNSNPVPHAYTAVAASQPFFLAFQAVNNRELLCQYGRVCAQWMTSLPVGAVRRSVRGASDKIRIGVASAHIRDHSVWNAITKGWLKHIDRSRFDIFLFQLSRVSDSETERARGLADQFVGGAKSLKEWVAAIQDCDLDALIYPEIGMDPMTTQLASLRLAPLQIGSWGHPETTGLPTMDLYLSAEAFEPTNAQDNYSERVVPLPNLGVYVEPLEPTTVRLDLKSIGLRDDLTLLLCPGTPFKYMPGHDWVWSSIAKQFPANGKMRLVFFTSQNKSMSEMLEQRLRRSFEREGVEFDAHVCIIPTLDRKRFFGLMQKSALMLDTLGFSGFNTALQGVECGLPVLAREGNFMRGRLASAIMRRLGLPELVATSDQAFVEAAIRLAFDATRRRKLRKQIIERREMIFHDLDPVRALETCLIEEVARSTSKPVRAPSVR